ncbi:MAG: succinyldiaminopimelate transaminase [Streptosporangiaceae bacterium]
MTLASRLPAFTWDRIAPLREKAGLHPDGAVDLSIGTPVDPVPGLIRDALAAASDAPGYPATWGTPRLRSAAAGWLARAHGVPVSPDDVLPVVGTKEFIAWLPVMLGLGPGDVVLQPELAYPTYDIGARLAGASVLAADSLLAAGLCLPPGGTTLLAWPPAAAGPSPPEPGRIRLVWVNSPSNPTGRVLPAWHLRKVVAWARERGAVVASDECYISLGWDVAPVSVLHPSVCDGSHEGVLAVHSLSKRSNLAGYRAGFVTGDPALVADLLAIRKQAGMIMPGPVQAAMAAALSDEAHAAEQRERYAARRSVLLAAFAEAGWAIDHSEAGLYLWTTHPAHDCWSAAELLAAEAGILVAPGELYGPAGKRHVRVALTATDERIAAAAMRLRDLRSGAGR